jgi:AraC-like DNA-binding protein
VAEAVIERTLHRTSTYRLAEFWCPPGNPRWRTPNIMPEAPHVVFPQTSAIIRHVGDEPTLANPNHVMFYNPGQRYFRTLHHPAGDRCWFLELDPMLLAELIDPGEFRFVSGPGEADVRLLLHAIVRHLAYEPADPLLVEEMVIEALSRTVAAATRRHGAVRPRTKPERRGLVERAKEVLTETATEPLSLQDIARRLYTSEYHLARVFRAGTGHSLHQYRNHLRLRLALDQLADPDTNLSALACSLGYASHSHFTDSFRTVFGIPPSRVRGSIGRGLLDDLRRRPV